MLNRAAPAGPWKFAAVLWLLAIVAYLPSFDVPFTFDDIPNIVSNARVQPDSVAELSSGLDARGGQDRPVAMVSFALNYLVGGHNVFGYHLVNLAIHLANVALVFAIVLVACTGLRRLDRPAPEPSAAVYLAFFGAAIWALHPVNTQAVVYIVQRMTALATTFYLVALLAFALWRAGSLRGVLAASAIGTCFMLGMGTKPIVVTLPAALWLMDVVLFGRYSRRHAVALVAMIAGALLATGVYVGWRPDDFLATLPGRDFSAWERFLTEGRVLWHYLGLYVWPLPERLHLDYAWAHSAGWLAPATTLLAWTALLGTCALAFMAARRWPWPAFAWLFFVAVSSVEASFLNLELVFEHRIYLPGAFLAVGALAVVPHFLAGRRAAVLRTALLLIVGLLGAGTVERNRQWADIGGFWAGELERGASLERGAINAAGRYNRASHPDRALAVLERARAHAPGKDRPLIALHQADALSKLGRFAEAEHVYREELAKPGSASTRLVYGLGQSLLAQERVGEAEGLVISAGEAVRNSIFLTALEASVMRARGRPADALAHLQDFLAVHPKLPPRDEAVLRFHIANVLHALDQPTEAYQEYRRIVDQSPEHWAAWVKIYQMLSEGGDHEKARRVRKYLDARGVGSAARQSHAPRR